MSGTPDLQNIKDTYWALFDQMRGDHQRAVGFGDLVGDRWERAKRLGYGQGTSVYDTAVILGEISVGENCWIGPSSILDGSGGLTIGDFVTISFGAMIASHSSIHYMLSGGQKEIERRPVTIGNRTIIGPGSFVGMGVTVGECTVIAPHSVVTRNIPPYSIVQGNPGRVVGRVVFDEDGTPHLRFNRVMLDR